MARAHQRPIISGTELRLVVTAQIVRCVFGMTGIHRLVPLYPCLAAAIAAGAPKMVLPLPAGPAETEPSGHTPRQGARRAMHRPQAAGSPDGHRTAITPAVMWKLIDGLQDGVVLADGVLVLANRRGEEMFGYLQDELAGHPVESLIPADLRAAHHRHLACYVQAPEAGPMGSGARLVGLRKDGTTFRVEISLSPLPPRPASSPSPSPAISPKPGGGKTSSTWREPQSQRSGSPRPRTARPDRHQPSPPRGQPANHHRPARQRGQTGHRRRPPPPGQHDPRDPRRHIRQRRLGTPPAHTALRLTPPNGEATVLTASVRRSFGNSANSSTRGQA